MENYGARPTIKVDGTIRVQAMPSAYLEQNLAKLTVGYLHDIKLTIQCPQEKVSGRLRRVYLIPVDPNDAEGSSLIVSVLEKFADELKSRCVNCPDKEKCGNLLADPTNFKGGFFVVLVDQIDPETPVSQGIN